MFFTVGTFVIFATIIAWVITLVVRRKTNEVDQVLEDWEVDYGPQRFSYIQLYKATDGFKRDNIVGTGGFGIVYRGVITVNGYTKEIAVKRIKRDIKDGLKDFVSEIVSISRLRHRNLIELLGYCRQRGELLLVYDFMPNGSLDRYLFGKENLMNWRQRFEIIKGVAAGLVYLHEEWAQVVVHRDIKSANVLLDRDLKSKLSDFGLARLYDHGGDSQTTSVVGTFGYLAPELTKTGKATTMTDVFAFGSMLLEVVSGRRPSDTTFDEAKGEYLLTMDWALECWKRGMLLQVVDEKLKEDYVEEEVYKVVQLAVLCSHNNPAMRLTIRQVMGILEGDVSLPPMSPIDLSSACMAVKQLDGFDGFSSRPISQTSQFEITSDIQSSPAEIDSTN
ncbi:putative Kinase [Zostera marina]|uniref:non-specific serine/threonine protein kinase n=1 Tax=Zostera marina TaxID=29655 RepID=A0A0K9NQY4_ZOSMR|nr:putative Kinase [Zostera marina]